MRDRAKRTLVSLLLLLVGGALVAPVALGATGARVSVSRTAAFHTAGQSLWGRGTTQSLVYNVPFFDKSWNENGTAGSIANVCTWYDIIEQRCTSYADFGMTLNGSSTGRVGLSSKLVLDPGALEIDYPVEVRFSVPTAFSPGKWITIGSSLHMLPGSQITTATPDGHMDLNGVFAFSANLGTRTCVFSCTNSNTGVTIPSGQGTLFTVDSTDVHDFTALQLELLGLSGFVQLPDLKVGPTTINHDNSLVATGSDEYAQLGINPIEWALELSGVELPFNYDFPLCCDASAGWTTFDSTFNATGDATQTLKFSPKIAIKLALPDAYDYVVRTKSGQKIASGHQRVITYAVGNLVDIRIPSGQHTTLRIVPAALMQESKLLNHTTTEVSFSADLSALEAHATVPAAQPFFNGVNLQLGPVYEQSFPLATSPAIDVWKSQWNVAGFNTVTMKALAIPRA